MGIMKSWNFTIGFMISVLIVMVYYSVLQRPRRLASPIQEPPSIVSSKMIISPKKITPTVVMSLNSHKDYSLISPIVTRVWTSMNYGVLIIATPDVSRFTLNTLKDAGASILQLPSNITTKTISMASISQVARLYAACISKEDNPYWVTAKHTIPEYMLLSDIDMIPVSKRHFSTINTSRIFMGGRWDQGLSKTGDFINIPMCYVGMTKERFATVLDLPENGGLVSTLSHWAKTYKKPVRWGYDQYWLTISLRKIHGWMRADDKLRKYVDLQPQYSKKNRLERADSHVKWMEKLSRIDTIVDCHVPRPPKWNWIISLLELILNRSEVEKAKQYIINSS